MLRDFRRAWGLKGQPSCLRIPWDEIGSCDLKLCCKLGEHSSWSYWTELFWIYMLLWLSIQCIVFLLGYCILWTRSSCGFWKLFWSVNSCKYYQINLCACCRLISQTPFNLRTYYTTLKYPVKLYKINCMHIHYILVQK